MSEGTIRRRVVVRGHVQGVFFRDTSRREARRHQVSGWVTNRPDGAVEAVFEGDEAAVDAMVAWAHRGPESAVVTGVEVIDEAPEGLSDFGIR
jgi:acylphosphatase